MVMAYRSSEVQAGSHPPRYAAFLTLPSPNFGHSSIEERWWSKERRWEHFSKCAAIHLLSDRFIDSLPLSLRSRVRVIPNPIPPQFAELKRINSRKKRILAVGRLAPQKRLDLLISAFAEVCGDNPDWDLTIVGEGELRTALWEQIDKLALQTRVFLPGVSNAIPSYLASSDIFVMPSEFEGFGMALVEAMAAGLPCVAFAKCNGPNEIIVDGTNRILVKDFSAGALAGALRRLLRDEHLREQLASEARRVSEEFSLGRVVEAWTALIDPQRS